MALFGKKAKDGGSDVPLVDVAGEDEGGVAVAVEEAPATGKKVKAARAPKAAKTSAVKNGTAVGLNIGNQFIKAVEVTSKGGELTVTAMGAVPTPPESYTNGNVLSVSALSGAIRQLWKGAGIKSKVAVTSVAGTGALVVRVIEVPKMSDGELGDNMKVDADRYIPFPPSEVVMDFKALRELPSDPDAPNMEVLLAAAQREIIDLHIQVIQKAKLDPRAIDVEPIAAARAMQLERRGDGNNGYVDYNEVTALVNLGATGTEISILRGDILVFTRVVPGGGNALTAAIAEGMGLPFADAERVKIDSADAIAPAGYNAGGGDFGFGDEGDFDFGGGDDLNSAFDDISANPAIAADDPFDLDFFNQTSQDEPGAGHAQKEGEPGEAADAFNFGDFNFDTPPAPPTAVPPPNAASTPSATTEPVGFDFGFDDLSSVDVPATEESAAVSVSTEQSAANSQEPPIVSAPLVPSTAPTLAPDFAASMGSAFDFDNFDLPTATPDATTTSIPVDPTPPKLTPTPTPVAPVSSFDFSAAPVASPAPVMPISFGLEDDNLASKTTPDAPITVATTEPTVSELPVEETATDPFSFTMNEPVAVTPVAVTPVVDAPVEVAPDLTEPAEDTFSVAAPMTPAVAPIVAAEPVGDEFDLDAIFGGAAVPPVVTPVATVSGAAPTINLEKAPLADPVDDFGAATIGVPASSAGSDDFDLSGIDTGVVDDFGAGFGQTGDFTEFGAGLGASGAAADAAALYGLISPGLEELAGEVRRSLEFHLGRYPDATISRLVLLGGGARLRNLDVFLTQMIGVPTAVGNPFAHLTVRTPKLAPNYASENGPLCAVALGLALRDFVN